MDETVRPRNIFETANEEEQLYFKMIDQAAKDRSDQNISNGRPAHAVYLLYKFFEIAEESIKIFTGNLAQTHGDVLAYRNPRLVDAAVNFLKKQNTSLTILLAGKLELDEGQQSTDHPFISQITHSQIRGAFSVIKASDEIDRIFPHHFLVMDGTAMRVEMDTNNATAIACFNAPELVSNLTSLFDQYVDRSKDRAII